MSPFMPLCMRSMASLTARMDVSTRITAWSCSDSGSQRSDMMDVPFDPL
jgi:hypothetical protein